MLKGARQSGTSWSSRATCSCGRIVPGRQAAKDGDLRFGAEPAELVHNSEGSMEVRLPDGRPLKDDKTNICARGYHRSTRSHSYCDRRKRNCCAKLWFNWRRALLSRVAYAQARIRKMRARMAGASLKVWRRACAQKDRWLRAILGRPRNMTETWRRAWLTCKRRHAPSLLGRVREANPATDISERRSLVLWRTSADARHGIPNRPRSGEDAVAKILGTNGPTLPRTDALGLKAGMHMCFGGCPEMAAAGRPPEAQANQAVTSSRMFHHTLRREHPPTSRAKRLQGCSRRFASGAQARRASRSDLHACFGAPARNKCGGRVPMILSDIVRGRRL